MVIRLHVGNWRFATTRAEASSQMQIFDLYFEVNLFGLNYLQKTKKLM